ncbi:DUF3307 domain-containing protein [archaeon]|nr:DUF3307 domain-containing protein [archaeon]
MIFFLQPGKWGENKIKHFKPRLYHCIQYSVVFLPVLYFLHINLLWVFWIFLTHLFIDDYKFVNWWNKKIKRISEPLPRWFVLAQDQILHILVLVPLVI